jgi:hypothetical protein
VSRRALPAPAGADDVRGVLASRYRRDEDDGDTEASPRREATPPRRSEATPPRRRAASTPRRPDAVTSRRREGRPSATAETTIATTVRFGVDELHAQKRLLLDLAERGRIKQLDRAEVDRALWRLLADHESLQAQVLDVLSE